MKTQLTTVKLDETELAKKARKFEHDIDEVLALTGDKPVELTNDQAYEDACEVLLDVKVREKTLAEDYKEETAGLKAMLARVSSIFKPAQDKHAEAEAKYKEAVRAYVLHLEAQAHGLRIAAGRLGPKDSAKRDEMLREADELTVPKVKGIAFTPRIEIEVWDFEKLPREFKKLVADEALIGLAVERGEEVPGVKWTDARSVRITPKHAGREA
jgi:hypothetical protein